MTATDPTFKSVSSKIKYIIVNKISALPDVAKCYGFDKLPIDQFPVVFVKNTGMDGEFWTNATNSRVYAYRILILYQIGLTEANVTEDKLQFAEDAVAQVVDEIINALDSDYELGKDQPIVLFVDAADIAFNEYTYEGGYAKGAELTVRVHSEYFV